MKLSPQRPVPRRLVPRVSFPGRLFHSFATPARPSSSPIVPPDRSPTLFIGRRPASVRAASWSDRPIVDQAGAGGAGADDGHQPRPRPMVRRAAPSWTDEQKFANKRAGMRKRMQVTPLLLPCECSLGTADHNQGT